MSTATATFAAGIPIELGKIERELKKLWDQGGEVMTRASLINLAVYSDAPDSLGQNTQLIAQIAEDHACRAIVISTEPNSSRNEVSAWISAHCHVSRAGNKQICSEQLSFLLAGASAQLLPNIVFSHLDSDLPFYLWWQGKFEAPMDLQLWAWVDRLIYDSHVWEDGRAELALIEQAQKEAKSRVVLCDLNWTRLVHLRLALAQFFDEPGAQMNLAQIERIEIDHAPGYRSTAALLIGWLAAQLKWQLSNKAQLRFKNASGEEVVISLNEISGEPIARISIFCGQAEYRVLHEEKADLLKSSMLEAGAERTQQLSPAGSNDPVRLMSEELMRGGAHTVYLRALNAVRELL